MRGRERQASGEAGGDASSADVAGEVAALEAQGYTEMSSRLIAGLRHGALECVICLGGIRSTDALWTCEGCHCILHAACVRLWPPAAPPPTQAGPPPRAPRLPPLLPLLVTRALHTGAQRPRSPTLLPPRPTPCPPCSLIPAR